MDANHGAPDGHGRDIDPELLVRKVASLRTYLMFVAGKFRGVRSLPGQNVSDLVDSVLGDALAKIRAGDDLFAFRSDKELRTWLANRLRWEYLDCLRRHRRLDEILQDLLPPRAPRTPGSDLEIDEQARLLAAARSKLDPTDQQLIEWRVDEGLTFEEIGRRRGYSASFARRAWLDALRRLESIYADLRGDSSR
jgi:RNA polymerase sigma factor (sigma-70 family)